MCFPLLSLLFLSVKLHQNHPFPSSPLLLAFLLHGPTTPFASTFGSARWWPKGAWHGGQRPSVLIRGVWHQGTACLLGSVPRHPCNNSPVCHQSRPSWLAGWRGRTAAYLLPSSLRGRGRGLPTATSGFEVQRRGQRGRIGENCTPALGCNRSNWTMD